MIKLFKQEYGDPTNKIIKTFQDLDSLENRYEELYQKAVRRYLDKIDFDASDFLEGEEKEEYLALRFETYE